MLSKKATRRTGITHFPLQEEKISQRELPPRGKKKWGASQTTRSGKRGHRLSRKAGRSATLSSENEFKGSRGKGGKIGGSCAGLLATRKSSKRRIATECYILHSSKNNDPTRICVRVWSILAEERRSLPGAIPTLSHSPQRRCPALFHRVVNPMQPVN